MRVLAQFAKNLMLGRWRVTEETRAITYWTGGSATGRGTRRLWNAPTDAIADFEGVVDRLQVRRRTHPCR